MCITILCYFLFSIEIILSSCDCIFLEGITIGDIRPETIWCQRHENGMEIRFLELAFGNMDESIARKAGSLFNDLLRRNDWTNIPEMARNAYKHGRAKWAKHFCTRVEERKIFANKKGRIVYKNHCLPLDFAFFLRQDDTIPFL